MNAFLLHYHDNTTDVSRYSAMSVAIKCKIVMRLELSLGRWQGFDKGDGGRQRLGGGGLPGHRPGAGTMPKILQEWWEMQGLGGAHSSSY